MIPDLAMRAKGLEEMDRPECRSDLLLRTVGQFASINRWFARYRTVFRRWVFPDMERAGEAEYHLVDLGAGGCDIAVWVLGEARRRGLRVRVTALDVEERIVDYARELHAGVEGLEVRCLAAEKLATLGRIDYVFANHLLHHLEEGALIKLLTEVGRVVRREAVLSDLRRSRLSYLGFSVVAGCCYRRSFALDDGLLSIRKGFVEHELMGLARRAGVGEIAVVERLMPGRLVLRLGGSR